jgi:hypothetical protein
MLNKLKYLCIFFALSGFTAVVADCHSKKAKEEWLFVITADRFELEGDTLTLYKKSDELIAFTDRPYRKQMHLTFQELANAWDKGENSFKDDPPNAYLTWEDSSGDKATMRGIELILYDIQIQAENGGKYAFKVRDWRNRIPQKVTGNGATMVVDPALAELLRGILPGPGW